ncbi:MAG: transcription termination factor Rho [Fusobacteria bacterium]|nr:transcription termination factor Rho [Fusobacteriota bacterium]
MAELNEVALFFKIEKIEERNRQELLDTILTKLYSHPSYAKGYLEIMEDGYGFLRESNISVDVYLSATQISRFRLRNGDLILAEVRKPHETERTYAALKLVCCNGKDLRELFTRPHFDSLTPTYPTEQLFCETSDEIVSNRLIDLIAPIGKGQRGLIVAPPKAGKTMFLIDLANAMIVNHPQIQVWILLIDERPEEVTDIRENVKGAEVYASTFDEEAKNHIQLTEMLIERAKRLVESGKDVVILMDSLTRLARAYNIIVPSSGKLISGGIDPAALYFPKKFFGAARNIKDGGSLTIIATALIETGSKMDDIIYEEFKGTGNMELHLDRSLAQLRLFPAVDILRSGTRKEEQLLEKNIIEGIWKLRCVIYEERDKVGAYRKFIELIKRTKSNAEMIKDFM